MGIPDSSLLDLIEKVKSWVYWGGSDLSCLSDTFDMLNSGCKMCCCECNRNCNETTQYKYKCKSCGRWLCGKCIRGCDLQNLESDNTGFRESISSCKFCSGANRMYEGQRKCIEKVHPAVSPQESPRQSPEPPSPCYSVQSERISSPMNTELNQGSHFERYFHDQDYGYFPHSMINRSMSSPGTRPSSISTHPSIIRVGLPMQKGQEKSPTSQYDGPFGQQSMAVLRKPEQGTEDAYNTAYFSDDLSIFRSQNENSQRPLDFENNGAMFSSSSSLSNIFPAKEKHNEGNKEPLKAVIQGHFRALVSQLLQGEGIKVGPENDSEDWLDIVSTVAWQAANFVRPDTSKGGSMDPGDYVKVKCIASGSPSESTLVKGVVCTKNIKHKRMTSQYKKPRLLLLAGALEYQKASNQLASFDTLLQQENDHLKMIISKIEALRPNVLLVEKSVASCAQEYLLAKEISLVLNVKRPLLERIARCTGALITPSVDSLSKARLGHCELFRLDRMVEDHETANGFNKKPLKTLMFFEGCPRRLGCTVLLKGMCRAELKKIKHVVQYAVFAAYHLSLETSFLADEGATLPKMIVKHSTDIPESATADTDISMLSNTLSSTMCQSEADDASRVKDVVGLDLKNENSGSVLEHLNDLSFHSYTGTMMDYSVENVLSGSYYNNLTSNLTVESDYMHQCNESEGETIFSRRDPLQADLQETNEVADSTKDKINEDELSGCCALNSMALLISHLGDISVMICLIRHLAVSLVKSQQRLMSFVLHTSKEISQSMLGRLPSVKLPGERDGKIWMWHRCLRCPLVDGVPPATRRVVMSDAAWGLSFGKFLELSFSNHATANRVASCGHSLQRDCLRFYG
ncbi:GroEL-like apical domain superfamily, partial [Sesbania bispinosa]